MGEISLMRISTFCQFTAAVDALGASPERLLRLLNMPCWHHYDPNGFVPSGHIYQFAERGAKAVGLLSFGVHAMEATPVSRMGDLGAKLAAQPTLFRALHTLIDLVPKYGSPKQWWLARDGEGIWICRGGGVVFDKGEATTAHHNLTGLVQMVRSAAGPDWRPTRVRLLPSGASGLQTVEMFSRSRITPDPAYSGILVPEALLGLPMRRTTTLVGGDVQPRTVDAPKPDDLAGAVREVIKTLLRDGYPEIGRTAEVLGLRVRTLQRYLEGQRATYKRLADQARFEAARDLLHDGDRSITDIGFDLGYNDTAHFTRAFRRWAGVPPSTYRRTAAVPTSANGARSDV